MDSLSNIQQQLLNWLEEYIFQHGCSPSTQQMREAIGWRSASSVRYHLKRLRDKGWLNWVGSQSRSYQFLNPKVGMVPILGTISAHSLTEVFPEQEMVRISLAGFAQFKRLSPHELTRYFALRVMGDSMIGVSINHGDVVIMKVPPDPDLVKDGTIVAARVEGKTTLKLFYRKGNTVTLKPANSMYEPTDVDASVVNIQGVYVGLVRNLL